MLQIFSRGLEEKQDKQISYNTAVRLGDLLTAKGSNMKNTVSIINTALTTLSKRDKQLAECILNHLIMLYPKVHAEYTFQILN